MSLNQPILQMSVIKLCVLCVFVSVLCRSSAASAHWRRANVSRVWPQPEEEMPVKWIRRISAQTTPTRYITVSPRLVRNLQASVVFQKLRHLPWICFIRHHAAESGREEIRERWLSCDWKAWHHGWMMPTFPAHQVKQTLNWLKVVTFILRIEDELFLSQVQCDSLFQNGSRQWKWTVPPIRSGPVLWILYNDMVRADCASVI